ncbi:MAG: hypothetical protein ACP5JG_05805 [Anaerolineae bacterium]
MISTVTTSTVSTLTTAMTAGLSLLAIVTLLSALIAKEIISVSDHPTLEWLSRVLDVAVIPLMMVFVFIAVVRVLQVLN